MRREGNGCFFLVPIAPAWAHSPDAARPQEIGEARHDSGAERRKPVPTRSVGTRISRSCPPLPRGRIPRTLRVHRRLARRATTLARSAKSIVPTRSAGNERSSALLSKKPGFPGRSASTGDGQRAEASRRRSAEKPCPRRSVGTREAAPYPPKNRASPDAPRPQETASAQKHPGAGASRRRSAEKPCPRRSVGTREAAPYPPKNRTSPAAPSGVQ